MPVYEYKMIDFKRVISLTTFFTFLWSTCYAHTIPTVIIQHSVIASLVSWLFAIALIYILIGIWITSIMLFVPGPVMEAIQAGYRWPKSVVISIIDIFKE